MEFNSKQLQIIEVAERLFASKGFTATSVRDIAQEANINISMISYYFGSKEKLVEAVFSIRSEESRNRVESILNNEELTPLQKINIWIDLVIDRLMSNQCFHKIMMREQLSGERTPAISEHILQLRLRNIELLNQLIREGQEAGVFKKDVDLLLLVTILYGTINQSIATQEFLQKLYKAEEMTEEEFQSFLKRKLSTHLKSFFKTIVSNEVADQN